MKSILKYRETGTDACLPSITELPRTRMQEREKTTALAYLEDQSFIQWRNFGKPLVNAFTGKEMPAWGYVLSDGEYTWTDDLSIYVDEFDIELPHDFINHVMARE